MPEKRPKNLIVGTYIDVYKGRSRGSQAWRWRFVLNHDIIAKSPEPYLETSINPSVRRLQKNLRTYSTTEFKAKNGKYYWNILSGNGKLVALSDKGYDSTMECRHFMNGFLINFPRANWLKNFPDGKVKAVYG